MVGKINGSITHSRLCFRVISIGDTNFAVKSEEVDSNFQEVYKALVAEGDVVCKKTSVRYPPISKPKAVILDVSSGCTD